MTAMQDQQATTMPRFAHTLLAGLIRELFQTEQSTRVYPALEADRLGDVPPAYALRAVAHHAETALSELPTITRHDGLPVSEQGRGVAAIFAAFRERLGEVVFNQEESYRVTLLGMRHGIDLVEAIRHAAGVDGDDDLVAWCGAWLDRRRVLVDSVANELAWFSAHSDRALEPARHDRVARGFSALLQGFESLSAKVRSRRAAQH